MTQEVRQQRNMEFVTAAVVENTWAGIGVAVLVFVGGYLWGGYSDGVLIAAGLCGLGFFGLLSVVRFSLDEFKEFYDKENYERTVAALLAENDSLRAELKHARTASRTAEFAAASKNAKVLPAVDTHAQVRSDIEEIVKRWAGGAKYGRDHCAMGRPRWEAASTILVQCGAMEVEATGRKSRVFKEGITRGEVDKRIRIAFERMAKHENTNFVVPLS